MTSLTLRNSPSLDPFLCLFRHLQFHRFIRVLFGEDVFDKYTRHKGRTRA